MIPVLARLPGTLQDGGEQNAIMVTLSAESTCDDLLARIVEVLLFGSSGSEPDGGASGGAASEQEDSQEDREQQRKWLMEDLAVSYGGRVLLGDSCMADSVSANSMVEVFF